MARWRLRDMMLRAARDRRGERVVVRRGFERRRWREAERREKITILWLIESYVKSGSFSLFRTSLSLFDDGSTPSRGYSRESFKTHGAWTNFELLACQW